MSFGSIQEVLRRLTVFFASAGLVALLPAWAPAQTGPKGKAPGSRQGVTGAPASQAVDIVLESGQRSRLTFDAIRKASTGSIDRLTEKFPFTPLTAVMKAAGIPADARIRVKAGDGREELTLQRGGGTGVLDPEHFGFIFNMRGLPVLTPRPGTPPARAPEPFDRPQVRGVSTIEVVKK